MRSAIERRPRFVQVHRALRVPILPKACTVTTFDEQARSIINAAMSSILAQMHIHIQIGSYPFPSGIHAASSIEV